MYTLLTKVYTVVYSSIKYYDGIEWKHIDKSPKDSSCRASIAAARDRPQSFFPPAASSLLRFIPSKEHFYHCDFFFIDISAEEIDEEKTFYLLWSFLITFWIFKFMKRAIRGGGGFRRREKKQRRNLLYLIIQNQRKEKEPEALDMERNLYLIIFPSGKWIDANQRLIQNVVQFCFRNKHHVMHGRNNHILCLNKVSVNIIGIKSKMQISSRKIWKRNFVTPEIKNSMRNTNEVINQSQKKL